MRASRSTNGDHEDKLLWVPLAEMSPWLVCAVIKAEDGTFFRHHGFDLPQIARAVKRGFAGNGWKGASTITQQLARNLYFTPARTPIRKVREAIVAARLEAQLTKSRLLELYLNTAQWGDEVWGAAEAANSYLNKPVGNIDAFEALYLASVLPAPRSALRGENRTRAFNTQQRVARQLLFSGILTEREYFTVIDRASEWYFSGSRREELGALSNRPRLMKGELPRLIATGCGLDREIFIGSEVKAGRADALGRRIGHAQSTGFKATE
jgi:monofunctional biosynthetic peptidoglycan transglycosylase